MAYTQEFINRVKQLYPNSTEMHRLAEEGNYFLGRWLDDSSYGGFSPSEVLNTTHEDLVAKAKEMQARRELYADFVSGKCYSTEDLHKVQCPAMYMQNSSHPKRYEFEKQICTDVGYVGYYPNCKKWGCKEQCWTKYDELNWRNQNE